MSEGHDAAHRAALPSVGMARPMMNVTKVLKSMSIGIRMSLDDSFIPSPTTSKRTSSAEYETVHARPFNLKDNALVLDTVYTHQVECQHVKIQHHIDEVTLEMMNTKAARSIEIINRQNMWANIGCENTLNNIIDDETALELNVDTQNDNEDSREIMSTMVMNAPAMLIKEKEKELPRSNSSPAVPQITFDTNGNIKIVNKTPELEVEEELDSSQDLAEFKFPKHAQYIYRQFESLDVSNIAEKTLKFKSDFEGGNLDEAIYLGRNSYFLTLRKDVNSDLKMMYNEDLESISSNRLNFLRRGKGKGWFMFEVSNLQQDTEYTFYIAGLRKRVSLFQQGMLPTYMYFTQSFIDKRGQKIEESKYQREVQDKLVGSLNRILNAEVNKGMKFVRGASTYYGYATDMNVKYMKQYHNYKPHPMSRQKATLVNPDGNTYMLKISFKTPNIPMDDIAYASTQVESPVSPEFMQMNEQYQQEMQEKYLRLFKDKKSIPELPRIQASLSMILALTYPYTYSMLINLINTFCKTLIEAGFNVGGSCRVIGEGNGMRLMNVNAGSESSDVELNKLCEDSGMIVPYLKIGRGNLTFVSIARIHPSETPGSYIMHGLIRQLINWAKDDKCAFTFNEFLNAATLYLVPMVNCSGVCVGNSRTNIMGTDLNRVWQTQSRQITGTVYYVRKLLRDINNATYTDTISPSELPKIEKSESMDDSKEYASKDQQKVLEYNGITMFLDLHGHMKLRNIFIYGCSNPTDAEYFHNERLLPYVLHTEGEKPRKTYHLQKPGPDVTPSNDLVLKTIMKKKNYFYLPSCKFNITQTKMNTSRVFVRKNLGVIHSYAMEASMGLYTDRTSKPNVARFLTPIEYMDMGADIVSAFTRIIRSDTYAESRRILDEAEIIKKNIEKIMFSKDKNKLKHRVKIKQQNQSSSSRSENPQSLPPKPVVKELKNIPPLPPINKAPKTLSLNKECTQQKSVDVITVQPRAQSLASPSHSVKQEGFEVQLDVVPQLNVRDEHEEKMKMLSVAIGELIYDAPLFDRVLHDPAFKRVDKKVIVKNVVRDMELKLEQEQQEEQARQAALQRRRKLKSQSENRDSNDHKSTVPALDIHKVRQVASRQTSRSLSSRTQRTQVSVTNIRVPVPVTQQVLVLPEFSTTNQHAPVLRPTLFKQKQTKGASSRAGALQAILQPIEAQAEKKQKLRVHFNV